MSALISARAACCPWPFTLAVRASRKAAKYSRSACQPDHQQLSLQLQLAKLADQLRAVHTVPCLYGAAKLCRRAKTISVVSHRLPARLPPGTAPERPTSAARQLVLPPGSSCQVCSRTTRRLRWRSGRLRSGLVKKSRLCSISAAISGQLKVRIQGAANSTANGIPATSWQMRPMAAISSAVGAKPGFVCRACCRQ